MVKIGFDGKRAVQNFTGLGNYSRYIADILCRFRPENDYTLYAPHRSENKRLAQLLKRYPQLHVAYPSKRIWQSLSSLWRVWSITRRLEHDGIALFHGLSNELPLNIHRSRVKSVVTIHDLIFLRFPQFYHPIDRLIYTYKFRQACRHADKIVAISECTKKDIMHFFHIPADKIAVIYQSCDPAFGLPVGEAKKAEVRQKYRLPDRFILNVGSIEERKNILTAARTLPSLPAEVHLVIVGRRTAYTREVEQFVRTEQLEDRVHIISNLPFDDLPALYQCAELFVYPSRFEGFGIPIIEALQSGIPVVATTGSCLEEAGGPDSVYVHPDDVAGMARAFNDLLVDPARRALMVEKGRAYAAGFSEEKQAAQLTEVYGQVLASTKGSV